MIRFEVLRHDPHLREIECPEPIVEKASTDQWEGYSSARYAA
jgi:hypothetical protein